MITIELQEVVLKYFCDGFKYLEIIELLRVKHNNNTSLRSLKTWLKQNGISKRPLQNRRDPEVVIREAIIAELNGTGSTMGYRRIHKSLLNKGVLCRREDVRTMLKDIDPDGVELRERRRLKRRVYGSLGPNYVLHIDG